MERFPNTVDHAEHRQRHLNRDGLRAGGLAGSLPPVMLRHGWLSSFLNPPLSLSQNRDEESPPASPQVQQRPGHPLDVRRVLYNLVSVDLTPDPRTWSLQRPEAGQRMRHRHVSVADQQALHVVVDVGSRQQDLGRSGPEYEDATVGEPSCGSAASRYGHRRPGRHGPGRVLPPTVRAGRQGQAFTRTGGSGPMRADPPPGGPAATQAVSGRRSPASPSRSR